MTTTTALQPGVVTLTALQNRSFAAVSPNDPGIPTQAYARMRARYEKCRALMIGNEAVRAGEEDFLPRFEGETDDGYMARVQMAALFPGFAHTVLASIGMLLQQQPEFGKDMPQVLIDLGEDIDGTGTHWIVFCNELLMNALVDGMDGILVEHRRPDDPALNRARASAASEVPNARLDAADEAALGLRPYWKLYAIDDVIKPIYETINGIRTLVVLSLRELVEERVLPYGVQGITQYRVYTNEGGVISVQLFREPVGGGVRQRIGEPVILTNQTLIPWSPLVAGAKLSEVEVLPTLMHLADLNIEHHQTKTNILNLETLACVPGLVRIGAQKDPETGEYPPITLGPRNTIEAPYMQGVSTPVYWLSVDVSVLGPARQTLEDTERAMARASGAFLAPEPNGVESLGAKRIKGAAQRATLSTVARAFQDCLELAWKFTGKYMKVEAGSIEVSKDFEQQVMDPQTMAVYIQAVVDAGLPPEVLVRAWIKGGRLPDDTDVDALVNEMLANANAIADAKAQAAADALKLQQQNGGQPGGQPPIPPAKKPKPGLKPPAAPMPPGGMPNA